jgi:hypothetical protein
MNIIDVFLVFMIIIWIIGLLIIKTNQKISYDKSKTKHINYGITKHLSKTPRGKKIH